MASAFIALTLEVEVNSDDEIVARQQAEKVGQALNTLMFNGGCYKIRTMVIEQTEPAVADRLHGVVQR